MPESHIHSPNTEDNVHEHETPETFVWTGRKVAATFTAGTLLVGGVIFGTDRLYDKYYEAHPPVEYGAPNTPGDRALPDYGSTQCPAIPESYLKKADALLHAPENPTVSKAVDSAIEAHIRNTNSVVMPGAKDDIFRESASRNATWRMPDVRYPAVKPIADQLGLHVVDVRPYVKKTGNGIEGLVDHKTTLRVTQDFLKQYGVSIELAHKAGQVIETPIKPNTTDTDVSIRKALHNVMVTFSTLPKEYVALSGIKKIVLAQEIKEPPTKNNVFSHTAGAMQLDKMWLDVDDIHNSSVITHELGHGVVQATCGGHEGDGDDPQFSKGMTEEAYDPKYQGLAYDVYDQKLRDIAAKMRQGQPFIQDLNRLQQDAEQEITTTTQYGHTSVEEDSAEVTGMLTSDELYESRHALAFPVLRHKFTVVLGRLLYYRPAIAHYFAKTMLKPKKTNSIIDEIMTDSSAKQ